MCENISSGMVFVFTVLLGAMVVFVFVLQSIIVDLIKDKHWDKYLQILGSLKDQYEKSVEGMTELEIFFSFNKVFRKNRETFSDMSLLYTVYWSSIFIVLSLFSVGAALMFICIGETR